MQEEAQQATANDSFAMEGQPRRQARQNPVTTDPEMDSASQHDKDAASNLDVKLMASHAMHEEDTATMFRLLRAPSPCLCMLAL